jgi:hypothetical protein
MPQSEKKNFSIVSVVYKKKDFLKVFAKKSMLFPFSSSVTQLNRKKGKCHLLAGESHDQS